MSHHRIKVTYKNGEEAYSGRPSKAEAEKLANKYRAMPTVKRVQIAEVGEKK